MLKHLAKFLFFFTLSSLGFAEYERPIDWSGNIYKIISDYQKVQKKFYQQVCRADDLNKYSKLITRYRGQGYYLPKLDLNIDRNAIIKNMHHFKKKIDFIEEKIERLKKKKNFLKFGVAKGEVDKVVDSLLSLKKQYKNAIRDEDKKKIKRESEIELKRLKKQFDIFMDQMFFMKSYNFPNDFLEYRKNYEKYRYSKEHKDDKKANEIFFFRRIVEDGAYDPNKTRPDKFIRTALDTLYLNIQKQEGFLSEVVRYDLDWLEEKLERIAKRGRRVQIKRLREWRDRTKTTFKFYQELVALKNKKKAKFLVKKENEAAVALRRYVYKKQAEVYEFWAKKKELYKAMFVFETILVHEVGVIDGKHGLERMNVAKVILNRYHDDFYNQLEDDQQIKKYISDEIDTEDEKWLNVLFKVGEFSFTYHYIPAVTGIYCPDMSRRGRSIRGKNLKFALKTIKSHEGFFKAFRYFSRVSMLGKIDMSTVWTDYEALPEMPGYKAAAQRRLMHNYYADRYQYLYTFRDARGSEYTVLKMGKNVYSMKWEKGKPVFYDYRNPHYFKYFSKKK